MKVKNLLFVTVVLLSVLVVNGDGNKKVGDAVYPDQYRHEDQEHGVEGDPPAASDEVLEYHKGSLCGYCTYCKFCRLCEVDCPCEVGPRKPNCHMCKYCKYCYMCRVCDTICQPGGIIDRVTARLFNTLPQYNTDEIDKDIDGVKSWIDKTKDEL
jgi:hypothetical protein